MIVKTYKAVSGSRLSDKDAVRIGSFLDKRFGENVRTPQDVVGAARPKRSPIHGDFEWDDRRAAESYRIEQAQYLLRSIAVVPLSDEGEERPATRAYHRVSVLSDVGVDASGYAPAAVVWSTPDLSKQVVKRAHRELAQWTARYKGYEELAGATQRVQEVVKELAA